MEILYENIIEGQKHNFDISKNVDSAGTPYDLLSIMHYEPLAWSKNGRPTIIAKGSGRNKFETSKEPTETDVDELNIAYQCERNEGKI